MSDTPTGTVTFLFTDVEGSTQHWERDRAGMSAALARHDELLRSAIADHAGHVFKTVGDAFCAAFARASDALDAALDAQLRVAAEVPDLRVRMALHTGQAEERDGDYFGPSVNRVARLLAVGHGGQVLLSEVTTGLVRDGLGDGIGLRDLGEHRLKDLARSERVFQLVDDDLPADFPPLASLESYPNNLIFGASAFIGREPEIETVRLQLLNPAVRLVTLTGAGGTGKTRLALQLAAEVMDQFPDGAFFVDLAPVTDPALVPAAIAQTLGIREVPGKPPVDSVREWLQPRRMLLILDNFEQVLAAAQAVSTLMTNCPHVTLLATSRAPLRVRGEREYPLQPLPIPPPFTTLEALSHYASVRLFVERATAQRPDFAISAATAPTIAAICAQLDGLPLAIELAAARIKALPPAALLVRLDARLRLLTGGARDMPERQQTMRAAIAWSHDLLDGEEQRLFRRLSVFRGGCTLEAAEGICAGTQDRLDVLDCLTSLVDNSLVRETEVDGEARYGMLETIREYAAEQLHLADEAEEHLARHAEWFAAQAECGEEAAFSTGDERMLATLAVDHANASAALEWALVRPERLPTAFRLIGGLWRHWSYHGHLAEGSRLCMLTLQRADDANVAVPPGAMYGIAATIIRQDSLKGDQYMGRALATFRSANDLRGVAWALNDLAIASCTSGDLHGAIALLTESLALKQSLDNQWDVAVGQHNLGEMLILAGYLERAQCAESDALASISQFDNTGLGLRGDILKNLGQIALLKSDYSTAANCMVAALRSATAAQARPYIAKSLFGLGHCAAHVGDERRSARLFGAGTRIFQDAGYQIEPIDQVPSTSDAVAARSMLTPSEWQAAWAEGATMSDEEVIAYALEE